MHSPAIFFCARGGKPALCNTLGTYLHVGGPPMALPLEQRSSLALQTPGGGFRAVHADVENSARAHEHRSDGPIPMSLPAILRNPRLRHLQAPVRTRPNSGSTSTDKSDAYVGKRRMRRSENSRFLSNPHTVRPTPSDFQVQPNHVRSTFAVQQNGRTVRLETISESHAPDFASPQHASAAFEVNSAMKGQFSMSLKDAQQFLRARQSKPDAFDGMAHAMDVMSLDQTMASIPANPLTFIEKLIYTAEREIASWLHQTVHLHGEHGSTCREVLTRPASSVRNTVAILEVRRTPALLVWHVDDAYNRLAVHCVARVLNCPSFSRPVNTSSVLGSERHTWILHPNPLVRGQRSRGAVVRRSRVGHTRTSSTSTVGSTTSSAVGLDADPSPLTAGILQHSFDGVQSPPVTDIEYTSTEEFTESDRGDTVSDVDF